MARTMHKLSVKSVSSLTAPGIYSDGANLYLRVQKPTQRSWVFIWQDSGRRREMGLGPSPQVGLAHARQRAQEVRDLIAQGVDPVGKRRAIALTPTFGEVADTYIEDRLSTVKSDKSVDRWKRHIGEGGYAADLRPVRVDRIGTDEILGVLRPLWDRIPSSAKILRGYIEGVLDVAKVRGHRTGENPARWAGHLALMLPAPRRLERGHHAALSIHDMPDFWVELRKQPSVAAKALQLTILTACRTSEVLKAKWEEFDLERSVWTIPAARMKAGREHRVPLSPLARAILPERHPGVDCVFPGRSGNAPLSNMAMDMVLRRMGVDVTVHGFRSTFRDWAGEMTNAPREVAEAALAHTVGNAAELAYRRGDAFEKRKLLMREWATFCSQRYEPANGNVSGSDQVVTRA